MTVRLLLSALLVCVADGARAQGDGPGRGPRPQEPVATPAPPPSEDAGPPEDSVLADESPPPAAPQPAAPPPPASSTMPRPAFESAAPGIAAWPSASERAPVLYVAQGLSGLLDEAALRQRLADALGRELITLVDPRAHHAEAVVWVALSETQLVLRVTPPGRPEAWQQVPRSALGVDPAGDVVRAVLEMFWVDRFARLDAGEARDPFCPRGMICVDAGRSAPWPPAPEAEVLDPWDTSYRRFYGFDPFVYNYPPSAALTQPLPGQHVRLTHRQGGHGHGHARASSYSLDLVAGGGVHRGGAFGRYELDALRRFPRFDFGLAFIAGRGQPEPANKARRAITALLERRFVADAFELDLGTAYGIFFATLEGRDVAVRPYARAHVKFALPLGRTFDMLVQSDLGTTFASVPRTGAVEYALSMGLRHRM